MEEEKFEEKLFEYKLKSLIELRTALVGAIAVLSGGVMWLIFLNAPNYRYFLLRLVLIYLHTFSKPYENCNRIKYNYL